MIVFGAIDFAAAVARIGAFLGYRVTVCDARPVFATARRFPRPTRWWSGGHTATCVPSWRPIGSTNGQWCVLTHDPRFDVPLLELALRHPLAYVGAMGSRRTHDERHKLLREAGSARATRPARLPDRVGSRWSYTGGDRGECGRADRRGPVGGTGRPLAALDGPIHQPG
ncbi:XdhC family protein [Micromonospora sp. M12]